MIKLHFPRISKYDRAYEPVKLGIPFARGQRSDISGLTVCDDENAYPSQFHVTARWDDGSIKWAFMRAAVELSGEKDKDFYIEDSSAKLQKYAGNIKIGEQNGYMFVDNGLIKVTLSAPGDYGLFREVRLGDSVFHAEEIKGPYLKNSEGKQYTVCISSQWEILEQGDAACIMTAAGCHKSGDEASFTDYVVKATVFAGQPYVQLDYQIINTEKTDKENICEVGMEFALGTASQSGFRGTIGESNYKTKYKECEGEGSAKTVIDADYIMYFQYEHIPETFAGSFFSDWRDGSRGLMVDIFQAYQNFPKALEADKNGIKAWIIPPEHEGGINFIRGVARTTRMMLYFHDGNTDMQELNARSLNFEMPDVPLLDKDFYSNANVIEDMSAPKILPGVERLFIRSGDERSRGIGMLHFGDAPDPGYTGQGRGMGKWVWENNEYDVAHALFLLFARCGERRFLDAVVAASSHWIDVDIVHSSDDPYRIGGHVEHSADHATGVITPSHQWVEGLLDYYHLTGDRAGYDCAVSVGENILKMLDLPRFQTPGTFSVRETGWALRALVAMYNETYEQRWLDRCDIIVKQYLDWRKTYGDLAALYTDHAQIRVVFMIAVGVNAMMRYYRIKPSDDLKQLMLDCVDDLVENAMIDGTNLFYYKELPSLRRLGNNTIILEALSYAYELTGDAKYIEKGCATFYTNLSDGVRARNNGKSKTDSETVIMPGIAPKNFAQPFYPMYVFYKRMIETGIIYQDRNKY